MAAGSNICSDTKIKGKSATSVYLIKMQPIIRSLVLFVAFVIGIYLIIVAANTWGDDRSEFYNVKILPANLKDAELDNIPANSFSYATVIDAGSSGCRAHVYRYGKLGSIEGPLYVLPKHKSLKVKPGLSSFANNPDDAGPSLKGLIDFMKKEVPEESWRNTPIWLKATAGLRLLPTKQSEDILRSVRKFLSSGSNSPFLFNHGWAKIISGVEEGGFGWIAYNYLKKLIGPKRNHAGSVEPYAVIEMGGASAQVTHKAPKVVDENALPADYRFSFTIGGERHTLYSHSYLGFGGEQAREALNKRLKETMQGGIVKDPCINSGYTRQMEVARKDVFDGVDGVQVIGSAYKGSCARAIRFMFEGKDEGLCNPQLEPYSFDCVHQPAFVKKAINILTFENFFWMVAIFAFALSINFKLIIH